MAVQVKHPFTSAKSDGGDATRIRPSNWNADHTVTAATNSLLGTTATTTVGEISCTAAGRAILDDADAAAQIVTLSAAVIPVGGSFDWWTDTLPAAVGTAEFGWLNGQAISRATYSVLFGLWGTLYGAGDGSTTFNVPDTRGRVLAGTDDMGGTASQNRLTSPINGDTLGATGGAESHALTTAELASHTHTGTTSSDGAHTHDLTSNVMVTNGAGGINEGPNGYGNATNVDAVSNGAHTHTFTTNSTGSGTAHNNVQPTIVCNKVVRLK